MIESTGGGHHLGDNERGNSNNEQALRKGEITLKAVKMSRIVGSAGQGANGSNEHNTPQASLMLETIEPMKGGDGAAAGQVSSTVTNGVAVHQGANGPNDAQMKLKIITTQIPQSLLIPTSNSSSANGTFRNIDGRG